MRRTWLTTIAASLCVAATSTVPATASPVGMALSPQPAAASSTSSWTDKLKFWESSTPTRVAQRPALTPAAPKPTDTISPWRHPFGYLSAAVSETPVAVALHRDKTEHAAASIPDKLSLETPTGPATPQFCLAMAQMAERQGNVDQARAHLKQALAKWPRDVELLRATARLEDRQGQLAVAEALYRRAVRVDSQHPGALNDLGLCLARQGKYHESVEALELAIRLQPDKALYRNNAATVLVEMHQDQRALAHLAAVHGPAEANYNLGQLLVNRGRPHEAIVYFQRAVELDPNMQPAQEAIAQLCGTSPATTPFAIDPVVRQPSPAPATGPELEPQQPVGEPAFPATARGPAFGTSTYLPPTRYYPQAVAPATPVYQTATAPRYLPPVQPTTPGAVVR